MALVRETIASEGVAPSYGMIQGQLGFKTRADVHRVVVRLEKRALLSRAGSGRVRRIRLG
jgi:transcriptional regulator of NAD metabolism